MKRLYTGVPYTFRTDGDDRCAVMVDNHTRVIGYILKNRDGSWLIEIKGVVFTVMFSSILKAAEALLFLDKV